MIARLAQVVGTPVPQPARKLAPLDPADPWVRYNQAMLTQAERDGDADAVRWYRRILRLEGDHGKI